MSTLCIKTTSRLHLLLLLPLRPNNLLTFPILRFTSNLLTPSHPLNLLRILISHKLIIVELLIPEPENNGLHEQRNRRTRPDPYQIRILDGRADDLSESVGERGGSEEERHDEGLHAGWGAGVGEFVGCYVAEAFGHGAEHVVGELKPDGEVGDAVADVAVRGVVAAG